VIVGHITWQGIPQPDARNNGITATLELCNAGVPSEYEIATDASGFFTVTTGLPDGSYAWSVKGALNLANSGNLTLSGPGTAVEMGLMLAGDCNNNNIVSVTDFNLMKVTFGRGAGDPAYDSHADFNRDALVNVLDFNLMKGNFGRGGAPTTCP
jgi:hypothetical protein